MGKQYKISKTRLTTLQNIYRTDKRISEILRVTPQYIYSLRKRYGLKLIPASRAVEYRDNDIYSSYKGGVSRRVLVSKYDISYGSLCKIIRRKENEFDD